MSQIRLVVADDQDLVRDGLSMILDGQSDMTVVGTATDGLDAVEAVQRLVPDVALVDIRMPRLDGLEATRRLVASGSRTRILVLTTYDLDEYVVAALRAGASGFLLKDAPRDKLLAAIRGAMEGDLVLAPSVTRRVVDTYVTRGMRADDQLLSHLTARETQVLRLVAQGMSNGEIADHLMVGVSTVKSHVAKLLAKLGLRDRVQAVVFAYETGVAEHVGPAPEDR
ncbi:MAG TPA: response regulator transcription factor [Nocardioidaceae bacterium]|nr:response regulator transcription factor [Nocardioidaceae bacterium]